jgi:hypothetical protein
MSNDPLPDDPARWPNDPYALLGVERQVDRQELRRAYVRLIRRFKPEHFPEQFRRIRDAYESIDGYLQYQEHFCVESPSDEEDETQKPLDLRDDDMLEDVVGIGNSVSELERQTPSGDEEESAWQLAIQGRAAEAYRSFQEQAQRRPSDASLYAKLYWLLVFHADLDPQYDRRQWLTSGLLATGFDGRLAELYDRELQSDPEEVLRPHCRKLFECRKPLDAWMRFTARSWQFLGLSNNWETIDQDMRVLSNEIADENSTVWARLLLASAEQFLWQEDPRAYEELAETCCYELEGYAEEHRELSEELDRNDYLAALTTGWRALATEELVLPGFVHALRDILRRSWVLPFDVIQPQLLPLLRPLVENPGRSLDALDELHRISVPVSHELVCLGGAFYRQRHGFDKDARDDEAFARQFDGFLRTIDRGMYEQMRRPILFHCIANRVTLDDLRSALARTGVPLQADGAERLRCDLPLRFLSMACQAFWE